eukprot:624781-Pleurochrysis_carterae.AAC.1
MPTWTPTLALAPAPAPAPTLQAPPLCSPAQDPRCFACVQVRLAAFDKTGTLTREGLEFVNILPTRDAFDDVGGEQRPLNVARPCRRPHSPQTTVSSTALQELVLASAGTGARFDTAHVLGHTNSRAAAGAEL